MPQPDSGPDLENGKLRLFQVDAFTSRLFQGNPAAVCPLADWLPDALMQAVAAENNLSETAFFTGGGGRYRLRWFTPACEVRLCGHATLATAFVLWELLGEPSAAIQFDTLSGRLTATKQDSWIQLDFPLLNPRPVKPPQRLVQSLPVQPSEYFYAGESEDSGNYVAIYPDEQTVRSLKPDFAQLAGLEGQGLAVTAPGQDCDFVSRYFVPSFGIDEDPVTGSTHCILAPLWAARLGKTDLIARQVSPRGGELRCSVAGSRVLLSGQACLYLEGWIRI
jgi:PhzF family phenazine biosynthesis protein